ncbi:hypothetical protein KM043_003731 [Ampulex compressa]|nr:hypothetical protein KM043_003731 [Ampulex compressa]
MLIRARGSGMRPKEAKDEAEPGLFPVQIRREEENSIGVRSALSGYAGRKKRIGDPTIFSGAFWLFGWTSIEAGGGGGGGGDANPSVESGRKREGSWGVSTVKEGERNAIDPARYVNGRGGSARRARLATRENGPGRAAKATLWKGRFSKEDRASRVGLAFRGAARFDVDGARSEGSWKLGEPREWARAIRKGPSGKGSEFPGKIGAVVRDEPRSEPGEAQRRLVEASEETRGASSAGGSNRGEPVTARVFYPRAALRIAKTGSWASAGEQEAEGEDAERERERRCSSAVDGARGKSDTESGIRLSRRS